MHFICLSTTVKYFNAFITMKDMGSPGRLNAHLQLEGTLGKKKRT